MRERGYPSIIARDLVPASTTYSVSEIIERLGIVGVDAVAEVKREDVLFAEGTKSQFHVEYYPLKRRRPAPTDPIDTGERGNQLLTSLVNYLNAK